MRSKSDSEQVVGQEEIMRVEVAKRTKRYGNPVTKYKQKLQEREKAENKLVEIQNMHRLQQTRKKNIQY